MAHTSAAKVNPAESGVYFGVYFGTLLRATPRNAMNHNTDLICCKQKGFYGCVLLHHVSAFCVEKRLRIRRPGVRIAQGAPYKALINKENTKGGLRASFLFVPSCPFGVPFCDWRNPLFLFHRCVRLAGDTVATLPGSRMFSSAKKVCLIVFRARVQVRHIYIFRADLLDGSSAIKRNSSRMREDGWRWITFRSHRVRARTSRINIFYGCRKRTFMESRNAPLKIVAAGEVW